MATADTQARIELLEASDEAIEKTLAHADPMILRAALYQLTGDEELVHTETETVGAGFAEAVVTTDAASERIRAKALEFLKRYRDDGAPDIGHGPEDRIATSLRLVIGRDLSPEEVALYTEETGIDPWARTLQWQEPPAPEKLTKFSVTIIGAGMGGLNAALMLKRAGIPFTVIEKNSGVGGTWWENRYPGIRVDSASRGYTHIYGVGFGYPYAFCPGEENKKYFEWVADTFDLRDTIRFETEVRSMRWLEEEGVWEIDLEDANGQRTIRSNAVITAVGFLNRPNIPEIPGMADFAGPSWHTARWPQEEPLKGRRFAVIGTGCSGYQLIPELALEADHVVVFQRTPQWLIPVPGYRSFLPEEIPWLDRNMPLYANFGRVRAVSGIENFGRVAEIDPDYTEDPNACNADNKAGRDACIENLHKKLGDPELVEKMTPPHPLMSARPVMVDAEYSVLDAIQRDNVTLVTEGVHKITRTGVEANDGTHYEVDAIVYATGFHATEYLFPMEIVGRDGRAINEVWEEHGARAYLGTMVTGFPNLWMIYGPNTNAGLNPAGFHEMTTRYALECMEKLIAEDKTSVDVKPEPFEQYNAEVDERNLRKVWSDTRANNYYWTQHGRSAVMCPFGAGELYSMLRSPDFDALDIR